MCFAFYLKPACARRFRIASGENASLRVEFLLFENPWLGFQSVLYERRQSMGTMQRVADVSGLLRDFGRLAHPNPVRAFSAR